MYGHWIRKGQVLHFSPLSMMPRYPTTVSYPSGMAKICTDEGLTLVAIRVHPSCSANMRQQRSMTRVLRKDLHRRYAQKPGAHLIMDGSLLGCTVDLFPARIQATIGDVVVYGVIEQHHVLWDLQAWAGYPSVPPNAVLDRLQASMMRRCQNTAS